MWIYTKSIFSSIFVTFIRTVTERLCLESSVTILTCLDIWQIVALEVLFRREVSSLNG